MASFSARFAFCGMLMLTAGACANLGRDETLAAPAAALARFPACDSEIKAFVALTRLAKQQGSNWHIYEPALEAMQDQIMDCIDDSYPNPIGI